MYLSVHHLLALLSRECSFSVGQGDFFSIAIFFNSIETSFCFGDPCDSIVSAWTQIALQSLQDKTFADLIV